MRLAKFPTYMQDFYSAVATGSPSLAANSLSTAIFDQNDLNLLLPTVQALSTFNSRSARVLLGDLFIPESPEKARGSFARRIKKSTPDELKRVAEIIRDSRADPSLVRFHSREEILAAVRVAIFQELPFERKTDSDVELTDADREFIDAMDLQGEWGSDQLLKLTLHPEDIQWSLHSFRLGSVYLHLAELCMLTPQEVLDDKSNRVGEHMLSYLEYDLAYMGMSLGMQIPAIDPVALGRYAIRSAGLVYGSQELLDMKVDDLPGGVPIRASHLSRITRGLNSETVVTIRELIDVINKEPPFSSSQAYEKKLYGYARDLIRSLGLEDKLQKT